MQGVRIRSFVSSRVVPSLFFVLLNVLDGAQGRAQASSAAAQGFDVTFTLPASQSAKTPVTVTAVYLGDTQVHLNTPVHVSGRWVRTVSVVVQNLSSKTITRGGINLTFPDSGAGTHDSPRVGMDAILGQLSDAALYRQDGSKIQLNAKEIQSPINIPPGQTMRVAFTLNGDPTQQNAVQRAGSLHSVIVGLGAFYFSDGTRWVSGTFQTPTGSLGAWRTTATESFFSAK